MATLRNHVERLHAHLKAKEEAARDRPPIDHTTRFARIAAMCSAAENGDTSDPRVLRVWQIMNRAAQRHDHGDIA